MVEIKSESKNRRESDGYNTIMSMVRQDDIRYDPWGTGMKYLFALADVVLVEFGEILPGYRPAPSTSGREDLEGYEQEVLLELLDAGRITESDLKKAYAILSRYDDWCRRDGRNY